MEAEPPNSRTLAWLASDRPFGVSVCHSVPTLLLIVMSDSLKGARLKLDRARNHLEVLGNELAAFNASEPYRIVHEPNVDASEHFFRAKVLKDPPSFLSVIIGDILQNMRSALEHLVWGLALKAKGSEPSRAISFPIYRTESAFFEVNKKTGNYSTRSGAHKIAEVVDPRVRAAIQELQPYKGKVPDEDWLFILNELARVDRHQSLSVIQGVNPSVTYGWRKRGTRGPFVMDTGVIQRTDVWLLKPFEDDAIIGHFKFTEPEMEVKFQSPPYVAFRNEGPAKSRHVFGTLINIRRHIERVVVPKLEGFF
jgi:hypothetical protein